MSSSNPEIIVIDTDEKTYQDIIIEILNNIGGRDFSGPPVFDPLNSIAYQEDYVPSIRVRDINDSQKDFYVILRDGGEVDLKEAHINITVQYQKFLVLQVLHAALEKAEARESGSKESGASKSTDTAPGKLKIFKRTRSAS